MPVTRADKAALLTLAFLMFLDDDDDDFEAHLLLALCTATYDEVHDFLDSWTPRLPGRHWQGWHD